LKQAITTAQKQSIYHFQLQQYLTNPSTHNYIASIHTVPSGDRIETKHLFFTKGKCNYMMVHPQPWTAAAGATGVDSKTVAGFKAILACAALTVSKPPILAE
jgi:hypothetical protein